ncbi:MAG: NAD(P)/FAD-dependent oxidoreductase [Clostridia bacterium]|nr:NAD(P)/FAD-dependent oxidoreductase [Clostridia bacterium]
MYDIIVIGAGPAGITAAIYAKRAGANVLVLYNGESNVEKTDKIENYYGFKDGIDGQTLFKNGVEQAKNLEVVVRKEEVLGIEKIDNVFYIETTLKKYDSKAVIIATGNKNLKPDVKGISEFEGKGISYCAICDGFFYREKNVAVIGNGAFANKEVEHLKNIANSVTILTNGNQIKDKITEGLNVNSKPIKQIQGENKVQRVEFEDGSGLDIDGIFIAIGEASGLDFAKRLGIAVKNDFIIVDENMQTNISGLYACGNVTGGLLQICKATYEGAKAGISAVKFIK